MNDPVPVYLDSNVLIYLIEQPPVFGPRASARILDLQNQREQFVVSDLTRLECRSTPVGRADQALLRQYDAFFNQSAILVMPLTTAVCDRATEIRGFHRFKTPDALHLAAALEAGCDRFLTNDVRLASFPDLTVEVLP